VGRRSFVHDYSQAAIVAVIVALFVRTFLVQAFQIPSPSMDGNSDSIMVGDHILVNKFAYGPTLSLAEKELLPFRDIARYDVVIFKFPGQPERDYVKRVIGLPGETLKIENGETKIKRSDAEDFSSLPEEKKFVHFIDPPSGPDPEGLNNWGPFPIPENCFFVMGDNRDDSRDSRDWGCVPAEYVRGRALLVYWSVSPPEPSSVRSAPSGLLASFWNSLSTGFTRTRWERTAHMVH
jgi:signal peptidase I